MIPELEGLHRKWGAPEGTYSTTYECMTCFAEFFDVLSLMIHEDLLETDQIRDAVCDMLNARPLYFAKKNDLISMCVSQIGPEVAESDVILALSAIFTLGIPSPLYREIISANIIEHDSPHNDSPHLDAEDGYDFTSLASWDQASVHAIKLFWTRLVTTLKKYIVLKDPQETERHRVLRILCASFLFEICICQRLTSEEFKIIKPDFLVALLDMIEALRDDDLSNFSLTALMLAINEQFIVSKRPNIALDSVMRCLETHRTFGENLVFMLNRASGVHNSSESQYLSTLVLKMLFVMFNAPQAPNTLFTNDFQVLLHIFVRELADHGSTGLTFTYLRVLYPLITHAKVYGDVTRKRELAQGLLGIAIEDSDSTLRHLIYKVASIDWWGLDPGIRALTGQIISITAPTVPEPATPVKEQERLLPQVSEIKEPHSAEHVAHFQRRTRRRPAPPIPALKKRRRAPPPPMAAPASPAKPKRRPPPPPVSS